MIILNKRKTRLDYAIKFLKRIHKGVYLLVILIVIAIPLYYRMLTMPEPTFEDQMKDYSKEVTAPELQIDIKFESYQKLLYQRRQALRSGGNSDWNMFVKFDEVPAKITFNGKEYKADLSLKGSRKFHYADSTRMSFQVGLKGENTIMGMKKFSLHDPKMRNYIYEWIFHELLRREGFIALKYDFIQVKINGTDAGVYAIEERPDKILLERYGYPDGPIFKLYDDTDSSYFDTVEPFGKKYSTDEWKDVTEKAYVLAKGFKEGRYKLSQTINSDMLAKYFAICDVFMYFHGSLNKSIRFYYNPVTGKFEPIGFDGHCGPHWPQFINSEMMQKIELAIPYKKSINLFQKIIFYNAENYDKEFLVAYINYLNFFSEEKYINGFFEENQKELINKIAITYKNQPLYEDFFNSYGPNEFKFSSRHIFNRAKYIRHLIKFDQQFSRNRIKSKLDEKYYGKNSFDLQISNNYSLPIVLKTVVFNDSLEFYPAEDGFLIPAENMDVRDYKKISFTGKVSTPSKMNSAKLCFKIAGTDSLLYNEIEIFTDELSKTMQDVIRKDVDLNEFNDILMIKDDNKIIRFKNGRINLTKHLKIPKGYKVIIESGTEINLTDSSFIISYSPIYLTGTQAVPIKITSDKTGGIAVFDCDSMSVIKNTVFENLSFPHNNEWKLTSAITFYKSPVLIENTEFKDNSSEDYLNVKLTEFKILNSKFTNVFSDAFDSDFSKGELTNCYFNASGNDAVDVSGSVVTCSGLEIHSAGDKAFSSGEGSILTVNEAKIADSEIGFASKDNSKIEASGITINNCKLGFTAYQKKPEYGPGNIIAEKVKYEKLIKETLVEIGSSVILNGKNIEGDIEDVKDDYLYGKEFGSPSKK